MSETGKTAALVGLAGLLLVAVWATSPRTAVPSSLQERGTRFFPGVTDLNAAASLEVVDFDDTTLAARPFKVLNRDGRWTIPSHYDYPADGASRLSSIAAAVIALTKDDVASDNVGDHEKCGVLDPLDGTAVTPRGRGTRVTILGGNDNVLADIILGATVEGREQLRYVRLPEQNRTYVARVDALQMSTTFEDWIERDLLLVDRDDLEAIAIRSYAFDGRRDNVADAETLVLRRTGSDVWTLNGIGARERIDTFRVNLLVTSLDSLVIADVRPKPAGLVAALSATGAGRISAADAADLESRGFYTTSNRELLSTGGELLVRTDRGIVFQLRFGDVLADAERVTGEKQTGGERRYLMIAAGFDSTAAGAAPDASVHEQLALLRARFAPWYYIVSEDTFKNVRLRRDDLVN